MGLTIQYDAVTYELRRIIKNEVDAVKERMINAAVQNFEMCLRERLAKVSIEISKLIPQDKCREIHFHLYVHNGNPDKADTQEPAKKGDAE